MLASVAGLYNNHLCHRRWSSEYSPLARISLSFNFCRPYSSTLILEFRAISTSWGVSVTRLLPRGPSAVGTSRLAGALYRTLDDRGGGSGVRDRSTLSCISLPIRLAASVGC